MELNSKCPSFTITIHTETFAPLINCVIDDALLKIDARHLSSNPETQHYDNNIYEI